MNDIQLWQLLQQASDDEAVLPLLEQLAELSLRERFPFFSSLAYLFTSDRPAIRRAAIRVIAGGTGHETLQRILEGLMDPDASVRATAVDALAFSAESDLPRLAHALFHPQQDVRRAALDKLDRSPIGWYSLFLCEDEPHAETARQLARSHPVGPGVLPVIIDLHRRFALTLDDAVSMILGMHVDQWQLAYPLHHVRSRTLVQSLLKQPIDKLEITGSDILDDALDLILQDYQSNREDGRARAWLRQLVEVLLAGDLHEEVQYFIDRMWISLLQVTERHGWALPTLEWAAVFAERLLADASIPRHLRRGAIAILYELRGKSPRNEANIRWLLTSDLARRDNGHLDLWAIGGLLFRVEKPYQVLMDTFTQNQITAAFLADPEDSCAVFCLPEKKGERRNQLVQQILGHRKSQADFLSALMVLVVNADGYDFLDELKPAQAIAVLEQIADLLEKPEWRLPSNKRRVAGRHLSRKLGGHLPEFLQAWLRRDGLNADELGLEVLANLANQSTSQHFSEHVLQQPNEMIGKLLAVIPYCSGFPYGHELVLAVKLMSSEDVKIAAWAAEHAPRSAMPTTKPSEPIASGTPLTAAQSRAIVAASDSALDRALQPALAQPRAGVATSLGKRAPPAHPHLNACCALLGCTDPLNDVATQFVRYAGAEPSTAFLSDLDQCMVSTWERCNEIWMLGHAWLWRWEKHLFAFGEVVTDGVETLCGVLTLSHEMMAGVLRAKIWKATYELLKVWRARDNSRYMSLMKNDLLRTAIHALPTDVGAHAANLIMMFHANSMLAGLLGPHREVVEQVSLDLDKQVRRILEPWISSKGVTASFVARSVRMPIRPVELEEIWRCKELLQLAEWCRSPSGGIVNEATLRLLELGEEGQSCLVDVLEESRLVPGYHIIAESIALWRWGHSLVRLRTVLDREGQPPQCVFMLGLGLIERGEKKHIARTLAALSDTTAWFRSEDWNRLVGAGIPLPSIIHSCVVSPQPHAYKRAVSSVLESPSGDAEAAKQLRRFLECGIDRLSTLRYAAAEWLLFAGEELGAPILMKAFSEEEKAVNVCIGSLSVDFWKRLVDSALQAGEGVFREQHLMFLLRATNLDPDARVYGYLRTASLARQESVQQTAARRMRGTPKRRTLLRRTAEVFHWGVQVGRQLTGRLFRVDMIGGSALGYTRLNEPKIYINPIAIFRGIQYSEDVVRGLIVHELGHHVYHRGEKEEAVWEQAEQEGIGRLLNLVADEHLERNLRALDDEYGNQLKRLGAYAFQHSKKEYGVEELLGIFRANSFSVLTRSKLSVAHQRGSVRVDAGRVLLEAERQGMSFPRFFRALRMGLGNRFADPLVAEALKLFGKQFRHSSMHELLEITRRLRDIFRSEACLLNAFEQDRLCDASESELRRAGEGITNEELQSEIQRIERKEDLPEGISEAGTGGERFINVIPDIEFETIDKVTPMKYSREAHRKYADLVRADANRLRRFLQDLGSRYEPVPRRLHGSRLARPFLRRLVLQRDPRVLISRERRVATDLFISVVVDCSGSMDYADNMERSKRFAMLVAEAARGVRGITVRLFGFTDSVIYDAGTADRPAVPALHSSGGNNDAAALWHACNVAMLSKCRAKLVVMISDGLPTECSVAALKALVQKMTYRMNVCCAQVAVQPLEEECFDHFVLLDDDNVDASVREFGKLVARLIRRAMAVAN